MKTSSAKAKGRRACQDTKELLLKHAPTLQEGDILVTSSSVTGEDLILSPAAQLTYPLVFECKNQETIKIWSALEQAESHCKTPNRTPVLTFKRNRSEMYCALKFEDFLKLIKKK